jgi:hypothetical protein
VRAAAAEALAEFPKAEVSAAVRTAWERDSSYAVRAAALGALVRLEPREAHTLLQRGLMMPAYQNVIQDASLFGVLQTGDTTLVDDVAAAVPAVPNAAHVLAAFAARGYGPALQMLEDCVYSPRAAVRQRALRAFQFSLPPAIAQNRLSALRTNAPSDRVREDIDATLARLKP